MVFELCNLEKMLKILEKPDIVNNFDKLKNTY